MASKAIKAQIQGTWLNYLWNPRCSLRIRYNQFYVFKSRHTLPHRMSDESTENHGTAEASPDGDVSGNENTMVKGGDENEDADNAESLDEDGQDAAAETVSLAERVAEYDETLAEEVASLKSEHDEQRDRIDELEGALKRSKADFENYKKRAKKREQQIRERATEDFVNRIVGVRDNLVRALEQDSDADIRPGIESTLDEFDRVLEDENVTVIDPEQGNNVDPAKHEVLMRVDAELPEGTVAEVFQQGYQMAGAVIQEAQITVSTGATATEEDGDDDDSQNVDCTEEDMENTEADSE